MRFYSTLLAILATMLLGVAFMILCIVANFWVVRHHILGL